MFDERPESGLSLRFVKQWDIERDVVPPVRDVWVPSALYYPLAGHAGDCAKVTHATISGETHWPCTCDNGDRA